MLGMKVHILNTRTSVSPLHSLIGKGAFEGETVEQIITRI